jgi:hypothetical protein
MNLSGSMKGWGITSPDYIDFQGGTCAMELLNKYSMRILQGFV